MIDEKRLARRIHDTKLTDSSRMKRKERNREWVMLDFYRMSAKDLIRVLDIDLIFGEMKLGSNPRRI
jgi:hypothetical protein